MLVKPLLAVLATLATASADINIWPMPASSTVGTSTVCLGDKFDVKHPGGGPAQDLRDATDRMIKNLKGLTHQYLSPSHGAEFFPNGDKCQGTIESLTLSIKGDAKTKSIAEHATEPLENRMASEAYTLNVSVDGAATIEASTSLGLFRGLTTFENLFFSLHGSGGDNKVKYAPFAPYAITDKPAFPWRSTLLDTSRHFFSVETIKRHLDTMAMVKLNVFHWHITDSQSWPLQLSALPELAANGAYSAAQQYSEDDVRGIVEYAAQRGIDVVMEIDTPGHTSIIHNSHPDYVACFEAKPWTTNANEPPAGQLRFANETIVHYVQDIFKAATGLLKSKYFGTGGDEINAACMKNDPETAAVLAQKNWTLEDALRDFTTQTHSTLREGGRTPVVWEEMALSHGNTGIGNDTLVTVWISSANARAVADKGFRIIQGPVDYFYLDCGQGAWVTTNTVLNSWCDPYKSWMHMLSFNPYNNLTESQHAQVVGGQASLWAEQTDESNVEAQMWPRAAALAEVFWSGGPFPRSAEAAVPRMNDIRYRITNKGIRAIPISPEWCSLRPGQCQLTG